MYLTDAWSWCLALHTAVVLAACSIINATPLCAPIASPVANAGWSAPSGTSKEDFNDIISFVRHWLGHESSSLGKWHKSTGIIVSSSSRCCGSCCSLINATSHRDQQLIHSNTHVYRAFYIICLAGRNLVYLDLPVSWKKGSEIHWIDALTSCRTARPFDCFISR